MSINVPQSNEPLAGKELARPNWYRWFTDLNRIIAGISPFMRTLLDDTTAAAARATLGVPDFPLGAVVPYAGSTAPAGWLLCFGQAVSRTTYAALFAITSTTYGVGDGTTTFNLPDLRGRVVAGQDDMGGTSANRLTGLTGGVDGDVLGGTGGAEAVLLDSTNIPDNVTNNDRQAGGGARGGSGHTGNAATAHNNVQPTIILNYIIFAGV